jgi:hypothetical protein
VVSEVEERAVTNVHAQVEHQAIYLEYWCIPDFVSLSMIFNPNGNPIEIKGFAEMGTVCVTE